MPLGVRHALIVSPAVVRGEVRYKGRMERNADPAGEPLDAYSRVVTSVAERLIPSVASLRVRQRVRGPPASRTSRSCGSTATAS
jgi:hypothetical protein